MRHVTFNKKPIGACAVLSCIIVARAREAKLDATLLRQYDNGRALHTSELLALSRSTAGVLEFVLCDRQFNLLRAKVNNRGQAAGVEYNARRTWTK